MVARSALVLQVVVKVVHLVILEAAVAVGIGRQERDSK
jgi:hypothetical protein